VDRGPDRHPGNWLHDPREPTPSSAVQFFGDWDNEERAKLRDRAGLADPRRRPARSRSVATPDRVARQLAAVGGWLEATYKFWSDVEVMAR
jgi:hypothetical protein